MPKTLEDVKSALTKLDDGQELYEVVSNAVLQERAKGKGLVQSVQAKHDVLLNGLKLLGYDPATDEIDTFAGGVSEKIKNGSAAKEKLTTEQQRMSDLEKTVSKLTKEVSDSKQTATNFQSKYTNSILKDALMKELSGKIYSAEIHAKDIIRENLVALGEDGKTVTWKNGDDAVKLDEGIQGYFDSHKDSLVNKQNGGSGGSGGGGSAGTKSLPRSAFDNLSLTDQLSHVKDGGTITD